MKQAQFLLLDNKEALYGGAAGGGKSSALLIAALQYAEVPGYSAILFRRTFRDLSLPGALMDRSKEWLMPTDATFHGQENCWVFPSGAKLAFGYLDTDTDKYRYQSAEFQFCVCLGTKILMPNGSYKNVENLNIGEKVQTLEGPKTIIRLHTTIKKTVVATVFNSQGKKIGEQIQSKNHAVLTPNGWLSYSDVSKQIHLTRKSSLHSAQRYPFASQTHDTLPPSKPTHEQQQLSQDSLNHAENDVSSKDIQSGSATSDDSLLITWRPRGLYVPVMLHVPVPQTEEPYVYQGEDGHVHSNAQNYSLTPNSQSCYCIYSHHDDEQSLGLLNNAQGNLPLLNDAAQSSLSYLPQDEQANTPECNRLSNMYIHPYTRELRSSFEVVQLGSCVFTPWISELVYDVTVEGASHYITLTHLINKNCGFDELTQFTEDQYRYLFSRLRRLKDSHVPLRMRSASNPGGVGHDWVKQRFMVEGLEHDRAFIPAKLTDNQFIDQPSYMQSLSNLDPITRRQYLDGDWNARHGGSIFRREWFTIVKEAPAVVDTVRYWDKAATKPKSNTDPDYTVGAKLGRKDGVTYILDIKRLRGSPPEVEALIKQTAQLDGYTTRIYMEQEPGSSGVESIDYYARKVLIGYTFRKVKTTGAKQERAAPMSSAAEAGNLKLLEGTWNSEFIDEAEAFPQGSHDDQVDAAAGAFQQLTISEPLGGSLTSKAF